jgi:TP901 family phage tail tape measure protein
MAKVTAYSLEARIVMGFDDKSLKQANQQIKREAARIQQSTAAVSNTFRGMMSASGAAFGAVAGGMTIAAATASKFEESFVAVKKTLNIGPEVKNVEKAFDQIANSLITLSKLSPVTTKELSEIAAVGGQLGVSAKDIVAFTKVIQKLTVATNLGAEQAALSMARLQEITGSSVDELDNLGATLVDLGNNFAATESEIVNAAMQIATATAQISGTLNNAAVDALAFSTALRAIGQPAQAGATAIVRLMNEASTAVELGGSKLETFASVAGVSMTEFTRLFEIDSTKAVAMFIKGLDDTSKVGRTSLEILSDLGLGQVRSRKAILALSKANQTLFDAIDTANKAFVENNALNLEAERRYDTLAMQIQRLKNIVSGGFLDLAQDTDSLEIAKGIIEEITNITYVTMDNFEGISTTIAKVIGPLMVMSTIFKQMNRNVLDMANALGIFDNLSESINATATAMNRVGVPTGKSVESSAFFDEKTGSGFGMSGLRGSRISMMDKIAGLPGMGLLGGLTGFVGGKSRRLQNRARQQYFRNRPIADMMAQGVEPYKAIDAPLPFDEFISGGGDIDKRIESQVKRGNISKDMLQEINEKYLDTVGSLLDADGNLIDTESTPVPRTKDEKILKYKELLDTGRINEAATDSAEAAIDFQKSLASLNYKNLSMFDKLEMIVLRQMGRSTTLGKQLARKIKQFSSSIQGLASRILDEQIGTTRKQSAPFVGPPQIFGPREVEFSRLGPKGFKIPRLEALQQKIAALSSFFSGTDRKQLPSSTLKQLPSKSSFKSTELARIPGVTGTRGFQKGGATIELFTRLEKVLNTVNASLLKFINIFQAKFIGPIKSFGSTIAVVARTIVASLQGAFDGFAQQPMSRREELVRRLARQRDRVQESASRGPGVADARAEATRNVNARNARRARLASIKEARAVIEDGQRQMRIDKILNRRRQMVRNAKYMSDPAGDGILYQADKRVPGGEIVPSAPDRTQRFDTNAGKLIGADRDGTFGQAPPRAVIRMQQKVNKAYASLSNAIMLQTVKLSNVLIAAAAKISAGFVNLGGAFAGIGFILKNLKGLIEISKSSFSLKTPFNAIKEMAAGALKGLPAPKVPKALPAGGPQLQLPSGGPITVGDLGEIQETTAFNPNDPILKKNRERLAEKARLAAERARRKISSPSPIGPQRTIFGPTRADFKMGEKVQKVQEAVNKSIDKGVIKKTREAAARYMAARARRAEEKAQAALNRQNAKDVMPSLKELKEGMRAKNVSLAGDTRSGKKRLDSMLDDFYGGGGNRAFNRGRRKLVLSGLDAEFGTLLEKSRELGKSGGKPIKLPFRGKDVKVTADLAKAFDQAAVSAARMSGILMGVAKFAGAALFVLRVLAPLIKMIANAGAEAKGLEEYKNSLREITNEFQELATNTIKLQEARKLLAKEAGVFSPDGPTTIAETLEEYVKEQEKALAKQSKNISEGLGKAFLDGMLLVENDIDEGGLAKRFMKIFEKVTGNTEQQIKEKMAVPIGEAIRGIFEEGAIPSFQDIFDQLLFAEDADGTYLSRFFTGTSREIIDAIIADGNPFEVLGDLYGEATADLDLDSLGMGSFNLAQADIGLGLFDVLDKYTAYTGVKGDELAQRIAQGNLFQGLTEQMIAMIGGSDLFEHELNEIFGVLAEAFNTAMPDATDTEVGNAIMEFLMFIETFNNLAGKSIDEIGDTLSKLPEDSDAMGALRDMLQIYLDEMITAGYLSERELLNAGKSTEKLLKLYASTQSAISDEITSANKKMQDEFGITAEMSLRLAIKAKEAFKQIKEAATALGKPLEDAELTDVSFGKLLNNLEDNRIAIEKYERDIAQLRAKGFEFTADRLIQMGLGGRDIAARALEDPMAAQALEFELIKTAPLTAADAGVTSPMMDDKFMDQMENMGIQITESFVKGIEDGFPIIRSMFDDLGEEVVQALIKKFKFGSPSKVMMQYGEWTSMGFAEGIENAIPQTEVAMQNMAKNSSDAFRAILGINSNSTKFIGYGQNVGDGFVEGLENSIGSDSGVNSTFTAFAQMISELGLSVSSFAAFITGNTGGSGGSFQTFLEKFMAGVLDKAKKYVSEQQKAFQVVTQLTAAERARNQALLGVMQSKASYAKQLREEASLQDRINITLERLNKLEQEGKAGNVTVKERIGILQQLLSLREMEKRAAGEFTAKEQLAINDKEQEVNTMSRMYNQGVISALEFQAAQEELAEMRGEFKTDEDKELFFLQLADTETQYKDAQANALKIDQELVSTREEYFSLLDEQEQMTLRVKTAQDSYSAATEGAVEADMKLTSAILYFEENIGPHMDTLQDIAGLYGNITSEVDELIEAVKEFQEGNIDSIFGPGGATLPKTTQYQAAKDEAIEDEINETVVKANTLIAGEKMRMQDAKTNFAGSLKEAKLYDAFNDFLNFPEKSPIFKQGLALNRESDKLDRAEQFMTSSDLGQIQRIMTGLEDMGLSKRLNTEQEGTVILKQFIESLGLNLYRKENGSGFEFLNKNLEVVEKEIGIQLGKFLENFGDMFTGKKALSANQLGGTSAANQTYIEKVLSGSPEHVEMDAGEEVDGDPNGKAPVYRSFPLLMENADGQRMTVTNQAAYDRAKDKGYTSTGRRGYAMGGRIKGFKMGGRIPDMSQMQPKKFAMGGRMADHMMKRALVGEYGPEEVRFVPGSGFLVKPLTTGGRGNNTIVQSLSVNVTGVPVDNASARKAAIQIKKALQRLDREGNPGGGVRNV